MHILIADDYQDTAESLTHLIEAIAPAQTTTSVAFDGLHAVRNAKERAPDVAFLDVAMPGMDGLMVGHRLRQLYGRRVFLVAMSGQVEHVAAARSGEDFDVALLKPVSLSNPVGIVETACAARRPDGSAGAG